MMATRAVLDSRPVTRLTTVAMAIRAPARTTPAVLAVFMPSVAERPMLTVSSSRT